MLEDIKGIGPKTIKLLQKLNIYSTKDLITYYPFRYDILKRSNIDLLNQGDKIIIDGIVENSPNIFHFNKKMNKMTFRLNTGKYLLNIVIFNRGFLKNKLLSGTSITIIGKYDKFHGGVIASDIRFGALPSIPKIEPIYHSTNGITSNQISNYIKLLLNKVEVEDVIPHYLKEKYNFKDKNECLNYIHNPSNMDELKCAVNYLKYEELFLFMLKINYLKQNKEMKVGLKRDVEYKLVLDFIDDLPFKLTSDQMEAVNKIYDDLISPKRMNRLLQGDVGSGKTIVAIIALYINYLSGYQGALMAPTEVLASQHLSNIKNIFKEFNINIEILTGSLKKSDKKKVYERLQNGDIDIIIGTHALFSEDVVYNNLGLVITDEQHRFGVNQRNSLKNKGIMPDILYLSATPIPRTYALTIYGDMDISSIKTLPNGRKEIITLLKKNDEIKDVLEAMYNELKNNHQIYVVAPLIEESDKIDLENVFKLEEKMNSAFSKITNVGVMHGKMSTREKDEVMTKFKNNEIGILISTTVIEVGVDVSNATMIVVFDAFRFGLSQLHQLRGRVGRNDLQSYCVLISDKEKERLDIMTTTNDGFKISEEDFKLRGSGDLFGIRQSGDMEFGIANIQRDFGVLVKAKEDSLELLNSQDFKCGKYSCLNEILDKSIHLD